ncbi:MAG TPA: hypothetical protein VMF09_02850 [Solirubrobacteraceae bacterium]|nr:hypothetical protein [Solirubrobacteraceae bacterium]
MDGDGEDRLLGFLYEFASMSEEERDAAIDALSQADRDALVMLAEARTATAEADMIQILDAGQSGLDKLQELVQPADLLAVINLAVREYPNIVVEALFAAVILHRGWDEREPAAIVALREGWHWHVHERIAAQRAAAAQRAEQERDADA